MERYRSMSKRLIDGVLTAFPDNCVLTGHPTERIPNHASFAFKDISGNDLVRHLDVAGVAASSGSACLTGDPKPSRVLESIGLTEEWTRGGLRLTVGWPTSAEDIEFTLKKLTQIIPQLEKLRVRYR
jgi:cysteine desulfurase